MHTYTGGGWWVGGGATDGIALLVVFSLFWDQNSNWPHPERGSAALMLRFQVTLKAAPLHCYLHAYTLNAGRYVLLQKLTGSDAQRSGTISSSLTRVMIHI